MPWPDPLYLGAPHLPWSLDATQAYLDRQAVLELPWESAFEWEAAAERGEPINTSEGRAVGHTWLRSPERAPTLKLAEEIEAGIERTSTLADAIRTGQLTEPGGCPFTDVLHIGIGGSQLGPDLLVDALSEDGSGQPRGLPIHFCDNIDPATFHRILGRLGPRLATTLVVVVSKSGSTVEPASALLWFRNALAERGLDTPKRLVAITCEGSALHQQAGTEGWMASLPLWSWVGGRFGTTSPAGLFTAGLAGLDTSLLLAGAAAMDDWTRRPDPLNNPAALLAAAWHLNGNGRGDRHVVVLPYADRLQRLGRWLQQVVMESIGKGVDRQDRPVCQGLTVFGTKGSTDQHAYVQQLRDGRNDALILFVQAFETGAPPAHLPDGTTADDILQGFLMGTRRALAQTGRPSLTLSLDRIDEHTLGGLVALFERAVGLYAGLIDVNAFDQPGVEAGKKAARTLLNLGARLDQALAEGGGTVETLAEQIQAPPLETLWMLQRRRARGVAKVQGPQDTGVWTRG